MFHLFAELIAKHLDAMQKLAITESALMEERTVAELREQFIAAGYGAAYIVQRYSRGEGWQRRAGRSQL